jgi:hypothetical protein
MTSGPDVRDGYAQLYITPLTLKEEEEGTTRKDVEVVFRIFIRQEDDLLSSVRFQISKDQALDFLYECTYDSDGFNELKSRQNLELEFLDFPNVVRQQLVTLVQQATNRSGPQRFKAVFTSEDDKASGEDDGHDGAEEEEEEDVGTGGVSNKFFIIYQKLEFSRAQVFKFEFRPYDRQKTSENSQARYDELSNKLKALETEYKDLFKRVQSTHPKLLDVLKRDELEDQ